MSPQCVCSLMVLVMVACCGYGLKVDRYNCTFPTTRIPVSADDDVCNVTGPVVDRELKCTSTSTKTPLLSDGDDTTYYRWTTSAFLSLAIPNNVCVGAIVMTFSNGSIHGIPSLTFEPNETVTTSRDGRPGDLVNTTITFTPQYCGQSVRINMERDGTNAILLTEVTVIEGGSTPSAGGPSLVPTSSAPGVTASNTAQVSPSNATRVTPSPSVSSPVPTSPQDGDDITIPVVVAIIAILLTVLLVVLVTVCVCVLVHKKTQWKPAVLYTSSVRFRNSFRRKSAFTDDQEFVMNKQSPQPEIIVLRNCKDEDDNDSCKSGPKNYKENYAAIGPSESIHHDVAAVVNNNNQQQQEQQQEQQQQQEGDLNRSSSQESIHSRDIPAKMMYGKVTWVHTNTLDHPYDDCGEGESRSQPQHHPHYEEPEKPHELQQTLNDRVIPVSPEASSSPTTVDSTDNENVSLVKPCENDTYEVPPDTLVNDRIVPSEQNAIVTNDSSTYDVPPDAFINDRVVPTEPSVSGLNEASVYDVPPDHDSEEDQTPLPTNKDQRNMYDLPQDCVESNTYEAPDSLPPNTTHTAPPVREGKGKGKKWFSWRKGKKEKTPKFSENTYEVPPDCQETKKKGKHKKAKGPLRRKERKSPPLPDVPLGAGGSGQPLDEQLPSQSAIYESPDSMVPRVLGVGGDTYAKLNECTPTEEMVGTPKPGQNHTTVQVEDEHTYSAVVKPPKSTAPNLPSSTKAPLSASPLSPPPLPSSPHQEPVYSQVDKENKKLTTYNSMTDAFDEDFWGGSGNAGEDQTTCVGPVEKTEEGKTPVQDSTYAMVDYSKKKQRPKK